MYRLNKTFIYRDTLGVFNCLFFEGGTWVLFGRTSSCQLADENCAKRQGWSLDQYYSALRADMAV